MDTITTQTGFAMDSNFSTSFYNELAAVPSLHVGFAVAIGFAIAASVKHPLMKAIALLWGPAVAVAVVATGNHYVFDIVAGVVASAAGYGLGAMAARMRIRRPRRNAHPRVRRRLSSTPEADRQRERGADHGQHGARAHEEGRELGGRGPRSR